MAYDLGDPVVLSVNVKDENGVLANATSVVLTITLPDESTATPSVTNPSTGVYKATYTPSQSGRHTARWVATGTNASAFVDVFDVRASTPPCIVSLTDAKAAMNWTTTDDNRDEEFRRYMEGATILIEEKVGPVVVRSYTERHESGYCFVLKHANALSVTSVVGWFTTGSTLNVADLQLDTDTGIVEREDGGYLSGGPFRVTVKAGMTIVPANISIAYLDLVRINFRTEQGGKSIYDEDEGEARPDLGMFVPHSVMANLTPQLDHGIA